MRVVRPSQSSRPSSQSFLPGHAIPAPVRVAFPALVSVVLIAALAVPFSSVRPFPVPPSRRRRSGPTQAAPVQGDARPLGLAAQDCACQYRTCDNHFRFQFMKQPVTAFSSLHGTCSFLLGNTMAVTADVAGSGLVIASFKRCGKLVTPTVPKIGARMDIPFSLSGIKTKRF